jgi:hypothetical protein
MKLNAKLAGMCLMILPFFSDAASRDCTSEEKVTADARLKVIH